MRPLEGIRVLELGQMIAVPAATHLLATQGASVIKIEDADGGDPLRNYGSRKGGMSGWFANANAGKRSLAVDLRTGEGKQILWALLDGADVLVQGFRPGVIERLGFGFEEVHRRHPEVVYVSSSGFGADGPEADRPVYDPVIQALSGWAGAQRTDGGPMLIRGMVADKVAALTTAQAIAAALAGRARTGEGQHVELSMLEANIAFNWPDVMMHCSLLDEDATHLPNLLAAYQLFATADGWVSVTAGNDAQWQAVCDALDRPELGTDPRFATAADRGADFEAWYAAFGEMCRGFGSDELLARCRAADVPAVPVLDPAAVVDYPQVVARGAVRVVQHPIVGALRTPRQGAAFGAAADGDGFEPTPAPGYGEHTEEILAELGHDQEAIARLRSAGTVR